MRNLIALVLSLGFLIQCSSPSEISSDNNNNIKIDVDFNLFPTEYAALDNKISRLEIIPLEITTGSAIQEVRKIIKTENGIFILDWYGQSLLKFDLRGKFITKIGQKGKGPGEYAFIDDISYVDDSEHLALVSQIDNKILFYNQDGEFQKEIKLPYRTFNTTVVNSDLLVSSPGRSNPIVDSTGNMYQLVMYDGQAKLLGKYLPIEKKLKTDLTIRILPGPEAGTAIFGRGFSPDFYIINQKGEFSPFMSISLGSYQIDTIQLFKKENQTVEKLTELRDDDSRAFLFHGIHYGGAHSGIEIIRGKDHYYCTINNQTHSVASYIRRNHNSFGSFNGLNIPVPICSNREYFIGSSNAGNFHTDFSLLNKDQKDQLQKAGVNLKKLSGVEKEDNPLVFFFQFTEE